MTSSLAGRVANPRLPEGDVRIGGFGGPEALARWLAEHRVAAVVDATHPFAERISASAARAAPAAGVPLLRLERPGWSERPGDRWHWVDDLDEAAAAIGRLGERVLLTTGRQGLAAFAGIDDAWFLIRCVDPPGPPLPRPLRDAARPRPVHARRASWRSSIATRSTCRHQGQRRRRTREAKLDAARERGLRGDRRAPPAAARRRDRGLRRGGAGLGAALTRGSAAACRRAAARAVDRARRRRADDQQRAHVDDVDVERRRAS